MSATVHALPTADNRPAAFDDERARAARREAEHLRYEAKLAWHRVQAHKRDAWRVGLREGLRQGYSASGPLLLLVGAIFGAALVAVLR